MRQVYYAAAEREVSTHDTGLVATISGSDINLLDQYKSQRSLVSHQLPTLIHINAGTLLKRKKNE